MTEDAAKQFAFPNFTTPVLWTVRGVLGNNITPREKFYLNGLGTIKGEYGGVSMVMKTGMEVDQDKKKIDCVPPIPQKYLNSQYRTIVAGPGMNPAPKFILPGHSKEKVGKETPPDALIMGNL